MEGLKMTLKTMVDNLKELSVPSAGHNTARYEGHATDGQQGFIIGQASKLRHMQVM